MQVMGTFVFLLIGYALGSLLSSSEISMNLAQTDWANLWVYVWMFLWPLMLIGTFFYYIIIPVIICLVGWAIYEFIWLPRKRHRQGRTRY